MFSDGYMTIYYSQQLKRQSSYGSSGIPVNVYWNYNDWYSSNLPLWRKRLEWYGIRPSDRYVVFTLNAFDTKCYDSQIHFVNKPANILQANISLIHNDNDYAQLLDVIYRHDPAWLYIQPFILDKLVRAYGIKHIPIPKSLKYIESVGEILPPDIRARATKLFGVPIANMYGSEEMNAIAYECPYHHMHVIEENVYLEICNQSGTHTSGAGEAIVTSLCNRAMPLLRYNQGDQIILCQSSEPCLCGIKSLEIKLVKGRSMDSIHLKNGYEINTYTLLEVISEVNNKLNDVIVKYSYEYLRSKNLLICYVQIEKKSKKWYSIVKSEIIAAFYRKISDNAVIQFDVFQTEDDDIICGKQKIISFKE